MYTSIRYFSHSEAEALLSQLSPLLARIKVQKEKIDIKSKVGEAAERGSKPEDAAVLRGQIEFMAKDIEELIDQVHGHGCLLKDLSVGLIDFPARIGGKEAYLCWKLGEPSVQFWHGIAEGYTGRKPL